VTAFVAPVVAMAAVVAVFWPVWRQVWADAHHPVSPASTARRVGRHATAHRWRPVDLRPHTPRYLIGAPT
jgi:hypothetical protein